MECYVAFLSHTDDQIGRFVAFLEQIGKLENTLMFVCADNGASAEGMLTGLSKNSNSVTLSLDFNFFVVYPCNLVGDFFGAVFALFRYSFLIQSLMALFL